LTQPPNLPAEVRPGDVLAGKYRVERILGRGGMGIVVAAHHMQLDARVALKFLLPEALANVEAVHRFMREARAAARITGEHVARVSDVGQLESGSPYIVMEYLDGLDLSDWLRQRGALPVELAVDFVLQACEAIADAHVLGIVHRDLKPANLFCVQRSDGTPSIKVLDFGISKFTAPGGGGAMDMTRTTALVGSPYYMSPEQLQSPKTVDARTDIWALGIILFELVSARVPFDAETVTELAIKIAVDAPAPASHYRADFPPGLELVIGRCLEKDRTKRFQTVADLAVALQGFASRQGNASVERALGTMRRAGMSGSGAGPAGAAAAPGPMAPSSHRMLQTSSSWGQSSATTRPRGGIVLAIVVGVPVLAVIAVATAFLLRRPNATKATATSDRPTVSSSAAIATTLATADPTSAPPVAPSATADPTIPAPQASPAAAAVSAVPPANPGHNVLPSGRATSGAAIVVKTPAAQGKPSCDPPYYFDAQGARIFKKECL
jgi:serine/threonine-protein kinase